MRPFLNEFVMGLKSVCSCVKTLNFYSFEGKHKGKKNSSESTSHTSAATQVEPNCELNRNARIRGFISEKVSLRFKKVLMVKSSSPSSSIPFCVTLWNTKHKKPKEKRSRLTPDSIKWCWWLGQLPTLICRWFGCNKDYKTVFVNNWHNKKPPYRQFTSALSAQCWWPRPLPMLICRWFGWMKDYIAVL